MTLEEEARSAAEKILTVCLHIQGEQELLVVTDETAIAVATILAETADTLNVQCSVVYVPTSCQKRFTVNDELSLLTEDALREAKAIITCVSNSPECLAFRRRIINTGLRPRTRVGHMPGASLGVLATANVNYDVLISQCREIALVLAKGTIIEIITQDSEEEKYTLTADIGGWNRMPVNSDGVIPDGAWGNIPSGETYISPMEGSAEGDVVIDGSIPGLVIDPGQEIRLTFQGGRLKNIHPGNNLTASRLRKTQIEYAIAQGDMNWDNLAEIGIGLNSKIKQLTGVPVIDEKMDGSAHIALGNSINFGGTVSSNIHCDMVFCSPTIKVDGKTILTEGKLRFVEAEWRENFRELDLLPGWAASLVAVSLSGIRADDTVVDRLERQGASGAGRVSSLPVGDEESAKLALQVYKAIPASGEPIEIHELLQRCTSLSNDRVFRLLKLLHLYGMINLH